MSHIEGAVNGHGGRWVVDLKQGQTRPGQCQHDWVGDKTKICSKCEATIRYGESGGVESYADRDERPQTTGIAVAAVMAQP